MIGIIGGLGVGATVHYYERIVAAHQQRGLVPQLLIAHADATRVRADVGEGRLDALAAYLAGFIDQLAAGGADVAIIPAVAPHICFAELAARSRLPLISMLDETARTISARSLSRVALFGTRYVIDSDLYGVLRGVTVVRPAPDEIDLIHQIYFEVVDAGRATEDQRDTLRSLAHTLIARDMVEAIVLAGTDLALVFNAGNIDFPVLDCAEIHIAAIMRHVEAQAEATGRSP